MLRRRKDPVRKAFEILRDVRLLKDKVSRIQSRIEGRIEELYKRVVDLQTRGEKYLATRYAEEIANLKRLLSRLTVFMYILDKIDLAVQHAIIKNEFSLLSAELTALIKEVGKLPESRLPDLGILFADLEANIRELGEISIGDFELTYTPPSDNEVKAILEEAKAMLRKELEPGGSK